MLRDKVRRAAACENAPAAAAHLDDLHRYLALFLGELLVQLHAKEQALEEPACPPSPRVVRQWNAGMADIIALLDGRDAEGA
jgi:hypothetical protein